MSCHSDLYCGSTLCLSNNSDIHPRINFCSLWSWVLIFVLILEHTWTVLTNILRALVVLLRTNVLHLDLESHQALHNQGFHMRLNSVEIMPISFDSVKYLSQFLFQLSSCLLVWIVIEGNVHCMYPPLKYLASCQRQVNFQFWSFQIDFMVEMSFGGKCVIVLNFFFS